MNTIDFKKKENNNEEKEYIFFDPIKKSFSNKNCLSPTVRHAKYEKRKIDWDAINCLDLSKISELKYFFMICDSEKHLEINFKTVQKSY